MTSGNLACVRRNAHTPHGTCPGTAPEFPSEEIEQVTDGHGLTRAEAAYAHLASFQAGDAVDVAGEEFFQPGTITAPQRADGDDITAAYLLVGGCGCSTKITVASLLDGMTVTLQNEAARGNVRYFDQAGYAARSWQAARRFAHWAAVAGRTARYLWAVRAAVPWPVKVILAVAMALKMMPLDFLADETLTVIAAVILNRTRPGLLKACFRAAQIRA